MILSMLVAALIADPDGAAPSPEPSPLVEIGHVKTRALCSALRNDALPSVQGILVNDKIIAASVDVFNVLQRDAVDAAPGHSIPNGSFADDENNGAVVLDQLHLRKNIGSTVQNLEHIKTLLADLDKEAASSPQDWAKIAALHKSLSDVAAAQEATVNEMNGFIATEDLGDLQAKQKNGLNSVIAADKPTPAPVGPTIGNEQIVGAGVAPAPNEKDTAAQLTAQTQTGSNPYAQLVTRVSPEQRQIAQAENRAAMAITGAAAECGWGPPH